MKYKVGDKVLIDCGDEDDGSLGNGLVGVIIKVDKTARMTSLHYEVKSPVGTKWYYEHELTLQE